MLSTNASCVRRPRLMKTKKKWYCKENETRDVAVSAWQRDNEFIQTETVQITAEKEQKI